MLEHLPRDRTVTVTASPAQGARGDLRPGRAAGRARVRRRAAPRGADGDAAGPSSPRSPTGWSARASRASSCPGGDAEPAGDYPDALALLEDLAALGSPFSHVGHHRLSRVAPDDPRRPHRAVHVGQAALRHPHRQQPDLRPRRSYATGCAGCGRAASTMPLLLGIPGPVERTKLLGMATKIGVGESTRFLAKNKGLFARLAAPGGFTGETLPGEVRAGARRGRVRSSRACTSSRSTRSPRPRPGAPTCSRRLRALGRPTAPRGRPARARARGRRSRRR